jgi:hypothetical protein
MVGDTSSAAGEEQYCSGQVVAKTLPPLLLVPMIRINREMIVRKRCEVLAICQIGLTRARTRD